MKKERHWLLQQQYLYTVKIHIYKTVFYKDTYQQKGMHRVHWNDCLGTSKEKQ